MVAGDKGLLAMDESNPTCNKRFARWRIPRTEEARRPYRELIVTTAGLGESISAAILYDETIRQQKKDGTPFVKAITDELASARLNAMNARFKPRLPWALASSFARAIQQPALEIWQGKESHVLAARQALYHRAECNRAARRGTYDPAMEMERTDSSSRGGSSVKRAVSSR
jgi:fructose-bisphosphate aldolase class I